MLQYIIHLISLCKENWQKCKELIKNPKLLILVVIVIYIHVEYNIDLNQIPIDSWVEALNRVSF